MQTLPKYKYEEDKFVNEALEYMAGTYGQHYADKVNDVQLIDLWAARGTAMTSSLDTAMKYLVRFGRKGGYNRKDLLKAIHYITFAAHFAPKEPISVNNRYEVGVLRDVIEPTGELIIEGEFPDEFGGNDLTSFDDEFMDEDYDDQGCDKCGQCSVVESNDLVDTRMTGTAVSKDFEHLNYIFRNSNKVR